jgi:predicted transcriptional regulator
LSTKSEANTKSQQLQWRRSKVIEMRSRGLSQIEIAHELQVSEASISSDMQYLRSQAKESIREYVTEHLPEQYQVCLSALDTILKHAFNILETSEDNREKLQAMELFKDTHLVKLELLSNATTIDSALNYISSKQHKKLASELASKDTLTTTVAGKQTDIKTLYMITRI